MATWARPGPATSSASRNAEPGQGLGAALSPPRVRARAHRAVPAGERVAVSAEDGPSAMLPRGLATLLRALDRFDTLDDHVARLGARPEVARRGVGRLRALGLVETEEEARQRFPDRVADPATITAVGIPTRDRPGTVQRLLDALPRGGPPIVVVD